MVALHYKQNMIMLKRIQEAHAQRSLCL